MKNRNVLKSSLSNLISNAILSFISFIGLEMAPKNSEFSFEQISFISLEVPDGKIVLDDRDPDLNYFNKMNIPSTETIYMNKTNIKKLSICDTKI